MSTGALAPALRPAAFRQLCSPSRLWRTLARIAALAREVRRRQGLPVHLLPDDNPLTPWNVAVHSHRCHAQRAGVRTGLPQHCCPASTTSSPLLLQRKAPASPNHSCLDQRHLKLWREPHGPISPASGQCGEPSPSSNLPWLCERAGREETASSETPALLCSDVCAPLQSCSVTSLTFFKLLKLEEPFVPSRQIRQVVVGRKRPVQSNPAIAPAMLDHEGQTQPVGCKTGSPKGDATLNVRSCNPQDRPS